MMNCKEKLILLIIILFSTSVELLFSQYSGKNNYSGNWEDPLSWVPVWPDPQNTVSGVNININGLITVNGSLTFTGSSGNLIVIDTLVVKGDLTLGDNNSLLINNSGILIVWGNLYINRAVITANGYFVIVKDVKKTQQFDEGQFSSNQNPAKVFVGGNVPAEISGGNPKYPALDCSKQDANTYANSLCSYGNLTALANTPVFDFYRSTCMLSKPEVTASGPLSFCAGDSVQLTSGSGFKYLWSNGATSQNINVKESGVYSVVITNEQGCESAPSEALSVNVLPLPGKPSVKVSPGLSVCSGNTITLESSDAASYRWSTGAKTKSVSISSTGDYFVEVTNDYGCIKSSDTIHLAVYPLPEKPLVSASGPLSFCSGDSVILNAGAGAEYFWSTGEKSSAIIVKKSGSYNVCVKNAMGCLSDTSAAVSVIVNPLPSVALNASSAVCLGNAIEVTGVPAGGVLKVVSGSANILNNVLTPLKSGNLLVEYTFTGVCSNSVAKNILVMDLPHANAGSDQTIVSSRETKMQAGLLPLEKGEWMLVSGSGEIMDIHSPVTQIAALGTGRNVFRWKVSQDECISTADVTLTVEGFIIPSVITPNGDGENEFFYIDPNYGKAKLLIFNKWGKIEYQSDNYSNNWNGRNSKGLELPDDTYFYVLQFADGVVKKGSILIKR